SEIFQEENLKNENESNSFLSSRPRIESKIGFVPITSNGESRTNGFSDNEMRNDNSNYDSLVGSLKSDTITWREQSTSDDSRSVESTIDKVNEKETARNLMLQKEQLRALQGRKRALLALQKRSEQRLQEQQELLKNSKTTKQPISYSNTAAQNNSDSLERPLSNISGFEPIIDDSDDHVIMNTQGQKQHQNISEKDLLYDIETLRNRLKSLRGLYDQKHHVELEMLAQEEQETENKRLMSSQLQSKPPLSARSDSYVIQQTIDSDLYPHGKNLWIENARTRRINSANAKKSKPILLSKTTNRLKKLNHVKHRLDELEQIVNYYNSEANEMIGDNDEDEMEREETVYEEQSIQPSDAIKLKMLMAKTKNQDAQNLDQLSDELNGKRMELLKAKTALIELQQLVTTIQPDKLSSYSSTPVKQQTTATNKNDYDLRNDRFTVIPSVSKDQRKTSLLSYVLSPKQQQTQSSVTSYADAKMAAQHREIERLVESRQRLHTIKDQIASLHNSMNNNNNTQTPPEKTDADFSSNSLTKKDQFNDPLWSQMHHQLNMREDIYSKNRNECTEIDHSKMKTSTTQPLVIRRRVENDKKRNNKHDERLTTEWLSSEENTSNTEDNGREKIEDIVAETERFHPASNTNNPATSDLSEQMNEIRHCLVNFIREQKTFNDTIEQNIRKVGTPSTPGVTPIVADPVFLQLQQQMLTQGLIVNLNSAYREIAVLQTEINSLQSENLRLSSVSQQEQVQQQQHKQQRHFFQRDDSKDSICSIGQIKNINNQNENIRLNRYKKDYDEQVPNIENSSKTSFNSQSSGKQTMIYVQNKNNEHLSNRNETPTRHQRNMMYTTEQCSSPKLMNYPSNYDTMTHHQGYRRSSKDNIQTNKNKPFIIRRRPLSSTTDDKIDYNRQKNMRSDKNSSQSSIDRFDEQKSTPSLSSFLSINHKQILFFVSFYKDFDNIDIQTLDLQIKTIMVQLIPYMRLHINEIFNPIVLNDIKDRILFLSKQQPDSSQFVRNYQNQFSSVLTTTIAKYCGKTIRECAVDLIRDISELLFNELAMYKLYENSKSVKANQNSGRYDDYSPSLPSAFQQQQSLDEELDKNDDEYQIELVQSESKPLMLVGSDEEDNDADEENNYVEQPETAVSRQQTDIKQQLQQHSQYIDNDETFKTNDGNETTDLNSNGNDYVLVNRTKENLNSEQIPQEQSLLFVQSHIDRNQEEDNNEPLSSSSA
ncbi:unnamed protein product, partial [Didymodactylos carnosus]